MTGAPLAILMGDLVHSERDGRAKDMHTHFNTVVARANADATPASPLTITLGDEFQGLFVTLAAAVRTARAMRFALLERDIDCRFALGIVRLDTPLNRSRAWNMMGPGLGTTRTRLEEKRTAARYRFALPDDPLMETLLEAIGAALTMVERGWTATQRRHVTASLDGGAAAALANAEGVSVHTIYKVRAAGHFEVYRQQWAAAETALAALDERYGLRA